MPTSVKSVVVASPHADTFHVWCDGQHVETCPTLLAATQLLIAHVHGWPFQYAVVRTEEPLGVIYTSTRH